MREVFVIKRNGDKQVFDPEKIQKVVLAAGIAPIDSEEIVEAVTSWVDNSGKNTVSSLEIRDKLFAELEKVDKRASGLFAWHQNRKNA